MGVRIDAFAVDLPRLGGFLDSSVADMVRRHVQDASDPKRRFTVLGREDCGTLVARPGGPCVLATGSGAARISRAIPEVELEGVPWLAQSVREYLASGSVYGIKWVFEALADCVELDFVERLMEGQRRWWIGSALQAAFGCAAMRGEDRDRFLELFRRVLRGSDCGHPIPEGDLGCDPAGLPFVPPDDPDLRIGRWSESESLDAAFLATALLAASPRSERPPGRLGIVPDDSEWDGWVRENLGAIARVGELEFAERNVISFIG
jgi:hypothetical protein